jgi:hypothetical protein
MTTIDEWAALADMDCFTCGSSMPFELLECLDGHDDDCPDRVCTGCGYVVVVGPVPVATVRSA